MSEPILQVNHLSKTFGKHEVLKDIDFSVNTGDVISIIGASGSGKSTLLRCINLLETPTSGEVIYHGTNIDKLQRITGYLVGTTERWNNAKLAELHDRIVHQ